MTSPQSPSSAVQEGKLSKDTIKEYKKLRHHTTSKPTTTPPSSYDGPNNTNQQHQPQPKSNGIKLSFQGVEVYLQPNTNHHDMMNTTTTKRTLSFSPDENGQLTNIDLINFTGSISIKSTKVYDDILINKGMGNCNSCIEYPTDEDELKGRVNQGMNVPMNPPLVISEMTKDDHNVIDRNMVSLSTTDTMSDDGTASTHDDIPNTIQEEEEEDIMLNGNKGNTTEIQSKSDFNNSNQESNNNVAVHESSCTATPLLNTIDSGRYHSVITSSPASKSNKNDDDDDSITQETMTCNITNQSHSDEGETHDTTSSATSISSSTSNTSESSKMESVDVGSSSITETQDVTLQLLTYNKMSSVQQQHAKNDNVSHDLQVGKIHDIDNDAGDGTKLNKQSIIYTKSTSVYSALSMPTAFNKDVSKTLLEEKEEKEEDDDDEETIIYKAQANDNCDISDDLLFCFLCCTK